MPYRQASTPGKKRPTFKKKQNWGLSKPQGLGQGTAGAEENLGGERGRGLRGGGGARRPTPRSRWADPARRWWPGARNSAVAPRPRLRPTPARPLRKRDASQKGRGGEGESKKGRRRRWSAPFGDRPTPGARISLHTVLPASDKPSLLAMSQSRHRAAASLLEREDSGTFRSASRESGPSLAGWGVVRRRGGGWGAGSPAAFWVKPLSAARAPRGCGGLAARPRRSVAWPRPSCGLGWAGTIRSLWWFGICGHSPEWLQHFYSTVLELSP